MQRYSLIDSVLQAQFHSALNILLFNPDAALLLTDYGKISGNYRVKVIIFKP